MSRFVQGVDILPKYHLCDIQIEFWYYKIEFKVIRFGNQNIILDVTICDIGIY
jgi:hypothetical protein